MTVKSKIFHATLQYPRKSWCHFIRISITNSVKKNLLTPVNKAPYSSSCAIRLVKVMYLTNTLLNIIIIRINNFSVVKLLTLNAHAREGYSSRPVCLSVCLSVTL